MQVVSGAIYEPKVHFEAPREICSTVETGTGSILFLTGTILWWLAEKYAVSPLRDNELSLIGMVISEAEEHASCEKTAATYFTTQSKLPPSGQDSQNTRFAKPRQNQRVSDNLRLASPGRFHSALGLRSRNLNVGGDVRVAAFFVTRIHRRRSVAIGGAVYYCGVRVQRTHIQHGVDHGKDPHELVYTAR